jgi:hypothetical protein
LVENIEHELLIEMLFASEMIVENRLRDPSRLANFADGATGIALLCEEFHGRVQDACACLFHREVTIPIGKDKSRKTVGSGQWAVGSDMIEKPWGTSKIFTG